MTNVVPWNGITKLDCDPQRVIQAALDAGLKHVVILGFDRTGEEYFSSSYADGAAVVWHCERAKFKLMVVADAAMKGEE
jgi:hypothetical protein